MILDSGAKQIREFEDNDGDLVSRSDIQMDRAFHNSSANTGNNSRNADNRISGSASIGQILA